jgi:regulator of sigma E protease
MTLLLSAIGFLLLLTGLIIIHEAGHFFAARWMKVEVEEFGFGLPPVVKRLFVWQKTDFTLNWIPFGGFVRLKGESAMDEKERRAKGSFSRASIPARCLILVAGVAMNFVLAVVIFTFGFSFGKWIPTYLTIDEMESAGAKGDIHVEIAVLIDGIREDGGADRARVPDRSLLTHIDGQPVYRSDDVVGLQEGKSSVMYTVLTGEQYTEEKTYRVSLEDGKAGVALLTIPRELSAPDRDILSAVRLALRESKVVMVQTVYGIGTLFMSLARTGKVPEGITGIVGIAQLTYTSVQEGLGVYLRLVALLSLSLAALNILPFPALDGGRLLFVLAEAIRQKPTNRRFEMMVNSAGFIFLLFLILWVTFYDVIRLFS